MTYSHTQKVPSGVLTAFGAVGGIAALSTKGAMKSVFGATMAGLVYTFRSLTVTIDKKNVSIMFGGWLNLKQIKLDFIESCETKRLSPLSGWGVHYVGDGWLYNVYGLDSVKVTLKSGKIIYIGTDEPEVLCAALEDAVENALPSKEATVAAKS